MDPWSFVRRPDVREDRLRLLIRRISLALVDRVAPRALLRPYSFRLTDGTMMTVNLGDSVARDLFVHGTFEWATLAAWRKSLPVGGVAVDVGAHVGTFTLAAARRVGARGRVIAFEPNPMTRAHLSLNVEQNGFGGRVDILPYALLDRDGQMSLGTPILENPGMSRLGLAGVTVECRTLDDVLDSLGIQGVDAIKIDVEGFEDAVLSGAGKMLAAGPVVIMEVNGGEAVARLRELGYELATPYGESFVDGKAHERPGESVNVVAVRPQAVARP